MFETDFSALNTEQAEQGLLGCIMLNPGTWEIIQGRIAAHDFQIAVHGRIFAKLADIVEAGRRPDAITIAPFFDNDPDLENVGRRQYLAALVSNVVSIHNAVHYAETIRAMAMRRSLAAAAHKAISRAADPNEEFSPILADLTSDINQIAASGTGMITQRIVAERVLENRLNKSNCDPTGLHVFDSGGMRGGLYHGRTYAIAAKAKAGKTTLAHSISYNLNHAGVPHAYIALEMGSEQIVERQIARKGRFNSLQFLENRTSQFDGLVADTIHIIPNNCLYLDRPNVTFAELKGDLSQAVLKDGIRGYFLDYWQLVTGKEKGQTQEEHQASVAQWLAGFNAKHKIWGVIICQLNKEDNAFGGAGINRACDQFYKLFRSEINGCENHAWLELEHSRYTFAGTFGSEMVPSLEQVTTAGPYFRDFGSNDQ